MDDIYLQRAKLIYIGDHQCDISHFSSVIILEGFSAASSTVAVKERIDTAFSTWEQATGEVMKSAAFRGRDIFGATKFRMSPSTERIPVWQYFITDKPVAVCRTVLGAPSSILALDQIWDLRHNGDIRREWRKLLELTIVEACETMWGYVNAVEKEDVSQEMMDAWYLKWRAIPKMAEFQQSAFWKITTVPVVELTDGVGEEEEDEVWVD